MDRPKVADSEWADVGLVLLTMMDLPHICRGPALTADEAATASLAAPAAFFVPLPSRNAAHWFPYPVHPATRPHWLNVPWPIDAFDGVSMLWRLRPVVFAPWSVPTPFQNPYPPFLVAPPSCVAEGRG